MAHRHAFFIVVQLCAGHQASGDGPGPVTNIDALAVGERAQQHPTFARRAEPVIHSCHHIFWVRRRCASIDASGRMWMDVCIDVDDYDGEAIGDMAQDLPDMARLQSNSFFDWPYHYFFHDCPLGSECFDYRDHQNNARILCWPRNDEHGRRIVNAGLVALAPHTDWQAYAETLIRARRAEAAAQAAAREVVNIDDSQDDSASDVTSDGPSSRRPRSRSYDRDYDDDSGSDAGWSGSSGAGSSGATSGSVQIIGRIKP